MAQKIRIGRESTKEILKQGKDGLTKQTNKQNEREVK